MKAGGPIRFAAASGAVALAAGLLAGGLALVQTGRLSGWAVFGWCLASATGMACGAWLVARHGTPGAGFLVALGAGMLARLIVFAGGAGWAVSRSLDEALAFVAGLAAGYAPTQLYEIVWFALRTRGSGI